MANGTIAASQLEMLSQSGTGIATIVPPATNTNRTLTLPDSTTTLVGTDATQTLTNKTIQGGALTMATAVSASGTSVDFTSIPSWVKRITVMFSGVSTNGTSQKLVRLGSGGIQTTGYISGNGIINGTNSTTISANTTGFHVASTVAADVHYGNMVLTLIDPDVWTAAGAILLTNGISFTCGGSVTLSGALDQVRITTVNGTDTFDAGTINIMYEG